MAKAAAYAGGSPEAGAFGGANERDYLDQQRIRSIQKGHAFHGALYLESLFPLGKLLLRRAGERHGLERLVERD